MLDKLQAMVIFFFTLSFLPFLVISVYVFGVGMGLLLTLLLTITVAAFINYAEGKEFE